MKVLTLINEKGGVGKTTLSVHIAAGLASRGKRVLIIDADAQAHATRQLRTPEYGGLYRLLVQETEWRDVLREPAEAAWKAASGPPARSVAMGRGRLWLLPSNVETRVIPMATNDVTLLRERLEEIEEHIDVVVIDTAPTPSMLHAMIYFASQYLLYPTLCEDLALDGVAKSVLRYTEQNKGRANAGLPGMTLIGVQPTMVDWRTNAHVYGQALLEKSFGARAIWPAMTARTLWRDAAFQHQCVWGYAPGHEATAEAWALVERVETALDGVAVHHASA